MNNLLWMTEELFNKPEIKDRLNNLENLTDEQIKGDLRVVGWHWRDCFIEYVEVLQTGTPAEIECCEYLGSIAEEAFLKLLKEANRRKIRETPIRTFFKRPPREFENPFVKAKNKQL